MFPGFFFCCGSCAAVYAIACYTATRGATAQLYYGCTLVYHLCISLRGSQSLYTGFYVIIVHIHYEIKKPL